MLYALDHTFRVAATVGPVVLIAWTVARLLVREADTPKQLTIGLLAAFTTVSASSAVLGVLGVLSFRGYVAVLWPLLAAAYLLWRKYGSTKTQSAAKLKLSWPVAAVAIVSTTVTIGALGARLSYPIPDYDELTYHLFFPNQWIAHHRVFLIDTPFGDAAPGYAPSDGELWYAWLMAPMAGPAPQLESSLPEFWSTEVKGRHVLFHGGIGLLGKVGQFPFLLLLAFSLTLLARRLGAKPSMEYLPAALLPFIPWVLREASSGSVDLMMSGLLVSALAFIFEYRTTGTLIDAVAAGLSLGLACSVKFVSLLYMPFVLVVAVIGFLRARDGKGLLAFSLACVVAGTPWYCRNVLLTSNPLFPADVSLFGHVVFPGAYTRGAMTASKFHAPDFRSAVIIATNVVGFWFSVLCSGGMAASVILSRRRPEWRLVAWIAPVALVWHFLVVPYNSQQRFLLWVGALTLLPLAFWADTPRGRLLLGLLLAALVDLSLIGSRVSFHFGPIQVPGDGLLIVNRRAFLEMALVALVICVGWYIGRLNTWVRFAAVALTMTAVFVLPILFVRPMSAALVPQLPLTGYLRLLQEHPRTVAYSGNNIPYFLAGAEGETRVYYVNVDGQTNKHLYSYIRDEALASRLDKTKEKSDWARRNPNFDAWLHAMVALGVQCLFVEPLNPVEGAYLAHDADGFPIERVWARGHPEALPLIASSKKWEIYRVLPQH